MLLTATSRALNQTYLQLATTDVRVGPEVLVGLALGTLTATVASAIPARRAAKNKPAETLRTAAVMQSADYAKRVTQSDLLALLSIGVAFPLLRLPATRQLPLGAFAASFSLLAGGALLVPRLVQIVERTLSPVANRWLGVEARLANQNLPRDLGRTSTTAGALMSGVALAVSFGIFTHSFATTLDAWIDQTLPGDLFITQSASMGGTSMRNVPMADTLYDSLASMPEVDTVRRVRIVEMPYRGFTIKAVSTDIDVFLRHARMTLLEGDRDAVVLGLRAGAIAVSENFSRRFHVHRGDSVALSTNRGTQRFQVVGVLVDYTSDIGSILIDRASYAAVFHDTRVDTYELHLHHSTQAETVRRRINAQFGERYDLFVLTNREFKAEVSLTTEQVFSLMRALELVALIVAVLGIVNAQLANVLDRIRELGILRALGMLRRQIRRMVVIEAALVGGVGTLAGVLLGMGLGRVLLSHINLVQTGWYFPYHLSVSSILEVSALTLPAAALAGLYPAHEASHLVVTEALEYE
jgi:putative ABC transport system permease protein